MNCWIVAVGEPLPIHTKGGERLLRAGLLAEALVEAGNTVVWWTSAFDHQRKRLHAGTDTTVTRDDGLAIELLYGGGYERNISVKRWADHRKLASAFRRRTEAYGTPDVLLVSFPPVELASEAIAWARRNGVPRLLDLRDMWPDLYLEYVPSAFRGLAKIALRGQFSMAARAMKDATGLCGITEDFLSWGLRKAGRTRSPMDAVVPFSYRLPVVPQGEAAEHRRFWDAHGIEHSDGVLRVCFFGTIGRQFDLSPLLAVARNLRDLDPSIQFVICGEGEHANRYRREASGLENVSFPGWVNAGQIGELMRRSCVGLDPMPERADFLATVNNKAIEYLCGGLALVSSPNRGALADLLRSHDCGLSVSTGDPDALLKAFLELSRNPARLQEMRRNARALYERTFRTEMVNARMIEHIDKVVRESASRERARDLDPES